VPITERQLAANRANAPQNTGPQRRFHSSTITPESKDRSARNARSHGSSACSFAVAHLKTDLSAVRLESALFTNCLDAALNHNGTAIVPMSPELAGDDDLSQDIEITRARNRNYALAEGFRRMARQGNGWSLFLRYQAQSERQYRRAFEEFNPAQSASGPITKRTHCGGLTPRKQNRLCPPDEPS
jgi:hypothetical protein